jgi:hypothetical protein
VSWVVRRLRSTHRGLPQHRDLEFAHEYWGRVPQWDDIAFELKFFYAVPHADGVVKFLTLEDAVAAALLHGGEVVSL